MTAFTTGKPLTIEKRTGKQKVPLNDSCYVVLQEIVLRARMEPIGTIKLPFVAKNNELLSVALIVARIVMIGK